jgi:hypothetical protein
MEPFPVVTLGKQMVRKQEREQRRADAKRKNFLEAPGVPVLSGHTIFLPSPNRLPMIV